MAYSVRNLATLDRPVKRLSPRTVTTVDFDTFYRQEFTAMVALAGAICGDQRFAEDLAQDALSKAHKNWAKISTYDRPGAWLRRVTINLALSKRRRLQRELAVLRRSVAQEPRWSEDSPPGSDGEVWEAVRTLPPRQRAVIALFYQQDLSTKEIAEALGCAVSTATSHLNQARTTLAAMLNEPIEEDQV